MPRPPIVQCPKCSCFFYWIIKQNCDYGNCPGCNAEVPMEVAFPKLIDIEASKIKAVIV